MPMHMIAYELSSSLAALTALTPVPDPTLRVAGNDFFVPNGLNNIVFAFGMINSAVATLRMQVQSPSLRATLNVDIPGLVNGLTGVGVPPSIRTWNSPIPLVVNEPLDVFAQNGAAVMNRALLILADGPVQPVKGKIYTVRATGSATLVTATWVNTALTFQQTLPAGHYQVVGFRAFGANLVACRIFFVGSPWRPGITGVSTEASQDWPDFHWGNIGVFGEFDNTVPPTIDCLGVTDTAQAVYFDLIKTA